jgi:hypothetical protein
MGYGRQTNATPFVATPDGSWTRMVGSGVNPDMPPSKEGRRNAPTDKWSAEDGLQRVVGALGDGRRP